MKYLADYHDGDRVFDVYLCKHRTSAMTKTGKPYDTVILQDKSGTLEGKIWEPNNAGIAEFDDLERSGILGDTLLCIEDRTMVVRLDRNDDHQHDR